MNGHYLRKKVFHCESCAKYIIGGRAGSIHRKKIGHHIKPISNSEKSLRVAILKKSEELGKKTFPVYKVGLK